MNVSNILSGNFLNANTQSISSRIQQFQKDFEQLGQDLQSGNLSAAATDFATLQKDSPQLSGSSSTQNQNPIAQALQQLNGDLQSGNLGGAQQDFATLQQGLQNHAAQRPHHHHHSAEGGQSSNSLMQDFGQLGQDLQAGDLASAQKAYTSLQQDMQQFALQNGAFDSRGQQSNFQASA
jgi:hypothetical protein